MIIAKDRGTKISWKYNTVATSRYNIVHARRQEKNRVHKKGGTSSKCCTLDSRCLYAYYNFKKINDKHFCNQLKVTPTFFLL